MSTTGLIFTPKYYADFYIFLGLNVRETGPVMWGAIKCTPLEDRLVEGGKYEESVVR